MGAFPKALPLIEAAPLKWKGITHYNKLGIDRHLYHPEKVHACSILFFTRERQAALLMVCCCDHSGFLNNQEWWDRDGFLGFPLII